MTWIAFSSTLNNKVAQQACASCYNGFLADVSVTDMQFLAENLEQTSWIKSWNGDDYSGSCMTIQPNGGGGKDNEQMPPSYSDVFSF